MVGTGRKLVGARYPGVSSTWANPFAQAASDATPTHDLRQGDLCCAQGGSYHLCGCHGGAGRVREKQYRRRSPLAAEQSDGAFAETGGGRSGTGLVRFAPMVAGWL